MNVHEYQAKQILQKYAIAVPEFHVASSLEEVKKILEKTGWTEAVLKIQIHAGGRGKAGGVKIAHTPQEILRTAQELLGKKIVNEQTGPQGMVAHKLLISKPLKINHEYYLGMTTSREEAQNILIASPIGGVNIEEIAQNQPEKVLFLKLPQKGTFKSYQLHYLAKFMGWTGLLAKEGIEITQKLTLMFQETDASLLEINPLIKTDDEMLLALDAKLVVDDNALYRQAEIKAFLDPTQLPSNEAKATEHELAYVALEGDIGCMVNGAGLAMATMDIIHHFGGRPANFLDVGGSATKEKIIEGFKIILSDPQVKVILVNIFGGIMNCETLATGIIEAAKQLELTLPLVVRMEGTNVEKGKTLIGQAHLPIVLLDNLTKAAQTAVALAKDSGGF